MRLIDNSGHFKENYYTYKLREKVTEKSPYEDQTEEITIH